MNSSTAADEIDNLIKQAITLQRQGRLLPALKLLQQVLTLDQNSFPALHGIGVLYGQLGSYEEALRFLTIAVAVQPNNFAAHFNRGNTLQQLKRFDEAVASYDKTLSLKPDFAGAYNNRGNILKELHRYDEALASFDEVIELIPANAEVNYNRGNVLHALQRYQDALASYDQAISLKPDYAEAYNNRGNALHALRRYQDALASYDQAIFLKPDYAEAYNNRGNALHELQCYQDALASYGQAIFLKPDYAEAYNNRGNALHALRRYQDALASYDQAISLKPDYAQAYNNRGKVLYDRMHYDDALNNFNKAMEIDPNIPGVHGNQIWAQMTIGLWEDFDRRIKELIDRVNQDFPATTPFILLAVPTASVKLLQKCALRYVADEYLLPKDRALWQGERYDHERIRIGYFSADFHNHATAHLISELIEKHDRSRFEVFAFSFGSEQDDEMRARLVKAFDAFFDVSKYSNQATAELARKMEIDVAVDLMGFTRLSRPAIFALRPAPVQVGYLGYPGTMGAPFIDYILADSVVIPKENFAHYTEKVVHLPHSYQVNDSKRRIADDTPTRSALGLPETGFVFCCFNNNFKITPDVFDIWMRLLTQVTGSVLWLFAGNTAIQRNLHREAHKRNVDPERLIFAPPTGVQAHLARHRQGDLFLDTFYYNAHTTASDALWAGLPLVTCLGDTFAGRVAASLLYALDIPELVTRSHEEYERLALRLATHPDALATIRRKLARNRLTQSLFNIDSYTQHIEAAYTTMWRNAQRGLAPDHIYIPS